MKRHVLITGGTGSIGDQLVRGALLSEAYDQVWILSRQHPPTEAVDGVRLIQGDLRRSDLGLSLQTLGEIKTQVGTVIHAAASTNVTRSLSSQRLTNLSGTAHLLNLARDCPHLERFILVSATQTAGDLQGRMRELPFPEAPSYSNAMQQTLWERERMALEQWLPLDLVRIAPVLGSMRDMPDGPLNPWHLWLGWMFKGYLPLLPSAPDARFDFVSKESVGLTMAYLLKRGYTGNAIYHLSQGDAAPSIGQVLDSVLHTFRRISSEWRDDYRSIPATVDGATFNHFQQTIMDGGHPIYSRVADQALYFLPSLLHPKVFENQNVQALYSREGEAFQIDWQSCLTRTIERLASLHWMHQPADAAAEVAMFLR